MFKQYLIFFQLLLENVFEIERSKHQLMEICSVLVDKQNEHKGFKDWVSRSTRRDHPSIVHIMSIIMYFESYLLILC